MMSFSTAAGAALKSVIQRIPDLTGWVDMSTTPMVVGGDTLTYQGTLRGKPVIVKCRRFMTAANKQDDTEATREASIWSLLDHANIHPFLGIVRSIDNTIFTVAEWIENGNAQDYVRQHRIDPSYLLLGTAHALTYLHSRGIYHGYVRAKNVLIARDGRALLTAFCCSSLPPSLEMIGSPPVVSPARWMAPEGISDDNNSRPSAKMDVWAFGMTILELFTRALPFEEEQSDRSVTVRVVRGLLPGHPPEMTDEWWKLCTLCWNMNPALRPNMSTIVDMIEEMIALSVETRDILSYPTN